MAEPAYLFRSDGGDPSRPDFQLTNTRVESSEREIAWTDLPIEAGAVISDFGYVKERKFVIGGMLSAVQLAVGAVVDEERVTRALEALDKLADGRTPVTLVQRFRSADVVIRKVGESRSPQSGASIDVTIECQTFTLVRTRATQISFSRLHPRLRKKSGRGGSRSGLRTQTTLARALKEGPSVINAIDPRTKKGLRQFKNLQRDIDKYKAGKYALVTPFGGPSTSD